MDKKIKAKQIRLGRYSPKKEGVSAGSAGLSDSDTCGVNDEIVDNLRDAPTKNGANKKYVAEVASIIVHELTHIDQDQFDCGGTSEEEGSACACEHAGAMARQLRFLLTLRYLECYDSE